MVSREDNAMSTETGKTRGAADVQVFDAEPEPLLEQERLNRVLRRTAVPNAHWHFERTADECSWKSAVPPFAVPTKAIVDAEWFVEGYLRVRVGGFLGVGSSSM